MKENRMCFKCLLKGHISRECRRRMACQFCQGSHSTSMHREDWTTGGPPSTTSVTACVSNSGFDSVPRKSSMIVPVYISHCSNPAREVLTYAMLDGQSDSSFITEGTAKTLGLMGKEVRLSLSTMTASDRVVKCTRFAGLEVRSYDGEQKIALPQLYSRKIIPVNRQHIPDRDMIRGWPYLEPLKNKLAPKLDSDVGILIGYDYPKAQIPRDVVSGAGDGPFGQRLYLGWGIVGIIHESTAVSNDPLDIVTEL